MLTREEVEEIVRTELARGIPVQVATGGHFYTTRLPRTPIAGDGIDAADASGKRFSGTVHHVVLHHDAPPLAVLKY